MKIKFISVAIFVFFSSLFLEIQCSEERSFEKQIHVKRSTHRPEKEQRKYSSSSSSGLISTASEDTEFSLDLGRMNFYYKSGFNKILFYLSKIDFSLLTHLNLERSNISDEGIMHLSKGNFPILTYINLQDNYISDDGVKFISSENFPALKKLNLSHNRAIRVSLLNLGLGSESVKYLAESNLKALTILNLSRNNIKDEGMEYFSYGSLPMLSELNLSYNNIGPKGAKSIANGDLKKLTVLNLCGNSIGIKGMKHLYSYGNFPMLKELDLRRWDYGIISDNGLETLMMDFIGKKYFFNARFPSIRKLYVKYSHTNTNDYDDGDFCQYGLTA